MDRESDQEEPEVVIISDAEEEEEEGASGRQRRPESPPYEFIEDEPVSAYFAVRDIIKRRQAVQKHQQYMELSRPLLEQSQSVEGAVHCYNEAAIRYHGMLAVVKVVNNPTEAQEQLIKRNVRAAKKAMGKIESTMRELQIIYKPDGRPRARTVSTQTRHSNWAQETQDNILVNALCEVSDVGIQTYETGFVPMIERVIVEVPTTVPPPHTGEMATQTDEITAIPPPAFCGLGIQPTKEHGGPPVEELLREFAPRSREASQTLSAEPNDLIELHDNADFMDELGRPSNPNQDSWFKDVQPVANEQPALRSEVHVVPRTQRAAPFYAEEIEEMRIAWEEFKEQYETFNKSHWKFSQAWRQYYVYATGKWSKRRPPQKLMFGKCRYCFIFDYSPGNHELRNCPYWHDPALGGPVHPCERYIWVELMKLCHNCFSPLHPSEKCKAPSDCDCASKLCQCEINHSHNKLVCGGDSVDTPPNKKPKAKPDGGARPPPSGRNDQRWNMPGPSHANDRKRDRSASSADRSRPTFNRNSRPDSWDRDLNSGEDRFAADNPFRRHGSDRGTGRGTPKW